MNNAMVLASMVTPNDTAAPKAPSKAGKMAKGELCTQSIKPLKKDFKQQLEACEISSGFEQLLLQLQMLGISSENKVDNSMCCDSGSQNLLSGIVGILEGFELLNYQTDNVGAQAFPQKLTAMIENMIAQATPEQGSDVVVQGHENSAQQMSMLSEKVAWMLQDNQLNELPNGTQQEILQRVGEYLCSFESTNKRTDKTTREARPAMVMNNDINMDVDPDKLGRLLLKAKTVITKDNATNVKTMPMPKAVQTKQSVKSEALFTKDSMVSKQSVDVMPGVTENRSEVTVTAADTMPKTARESAFVKDNVIRIVDKASAHMSEGKVDFDIELKPDFLGKLNIKLTMENGDLKMLIKTENMAAKGMFTNEMPAMQDALREKGIDISHIDLTYESQSSVGDERQAFGQNNRNSSRKRNWRKTLSVDQAATSVFYDATTQAPDLMLQNSSVEYHA